nr:hypothetical protein [Tanacetum cinerariifolium]
GLAGTYSEHGNLQMTRCGFVLGSNGGGDRESCKWREIEKVGFTEGLSVKVLVAALTPLVYV